MTAGNSSNISKIYTKPLINSWSSRK